SSATLSGNGTLTLAAGTNNINVSSNIPFTISSLVTGSGSFTKYNGGTLTFTNGSNNYSGSTSINAGTLSIGASANLGDNSVTNTLTLAGGSLSTSAGFTNTRNITIGTGGGTITSTSGTAVYDGTI